MYPVVTTTTSVSNGNGGVSNGCSSNANSSNGNANNTDLEITNVSGNKAARKKPFTQERADAYFDTTDKR